MDKKFFTGKNQIITSKKKNNITSKFIYDKKLEEELISSIIHTQNKESTIQTFDLLTDKIVNTGSIEYIRYVYYQVIINVMDALYGIGIDSC